jgi:hypothetical protein
VGLGVEGTQFSPDKCLRPLPTISLRTPGGGRTDHTLSRELGQPSPTPWSHFPRGRIARGLGLGTLHQEPTRCHEVTMMPKGTATMGAVGDLLRTLGAGSDQSPHHGIAGRRVVAVDGGTLRRVEHQVTRGQGRSSLKQRRCPPRGVETPRALRAQ